ncbi:hypothetical protein ACJX0J_037582, partial [Zea mays]
MKFVLLVIVVLLRIDKCSIIRIYYILDNFCWFMYWNNTHLCHIICIPWYLKYFGFENLLAAYSESTINTYHRNILGICIIGTFTRIYLGLGRRRVGRRRVLLGR